jgi:phage gp29-like protein
MRVCARMNLFQNYAEKDWMGFAGIDAMLLRVGKYESGAARCDGGEDGVGTQALI